LSTVPESSRKTIWALAPSKLAVRKELQGENVGMKTFLWMAGAVCGAVAGLMIWERQRNGKVEDLAHRLESAWADHHTVA
jgi:hypothetical protein